MSFDVYATFETQAGVKFAGTCGQDIAPLQVKASSHTKVVSVEYAVEAVLDPTNGQPANKRFHHPFEIMIEHDKNLPLFFRALVTGESFKLIELTFAQVKQVKQTAQGDTATQAGEQIAMKFSMMNAHVKDLAFSTGLSADKHGASSASTSSSRVSYDQQELVRVSFLAQKYLIVRPSDSNAQHLDDWAKGMLTK
ncbi:MAG: type VI secretion system tube protein Hcp [Myxococcales bacterium]|nr:type VI secretion system tube protein Hcp [Myxococcales bacterium]